MEPFYGSVQANAKRVHWNLEETRASSNGQSISVKKRKEKPKTTSNFHGGKNICLIWIRITLRKNGFINTRDISIEEKQMSTKKKTVKPKSNPEPVDLLALSGTKKTRFLMQIKERLRQKVMEAEFLNSFAGIERVTINGQIIDF
jgi:hypothetical protein